MLNPRKYNLIFTIILVSFLTSCSLFQNHHPTNEVKREVASESWESYFDRPDILEVAPQEHAGLMTQWSELKRAHIEAVAMFLEMYPDRELYFLARDSELLYDVARLALKDEPERLAKIHLLNISRANMRAENVQKYLAQEGISNETLEAGKKVLFIDTGFSGTIPRVLKEYFPAKYHEQLKTHLLCSSNPEHPSTRSFLVWLNSEVVNMSPGNMHGTIIGYEHMPRYTDRSSKFEFRQGQWHPVSTAVNSSHDGQVSKDLAQKYMEDLKLYFESNTASEIFKKRRSFWKNTFAQPKESLTEYLKKLMANATDVDKKIIQSSILDINEMAKDKLNLEEFGLKKIINSASMASSNKNELIKKFPEWKSILEDPENGIKKLFENNDLATLGKIIDTVKDKEINIIISKLAGSSDTTFNRNVIDVLILKKDISTLQYLAMDTFSQPHTKDMTELIAATIKAAVELKDVGTLQNLARYTYSQPHTKDMTEQFSALINGAVELKDTATLQSLAHDTFSKPHTKDMAEQFSNLIKGAVELKDTLTLRTLAYHTFSESYTKDMTEQLSALLKGAVELKDTGTLRYLELYAFSLPHTKDMVKQKNSVENFFKDGDWQILKNTLDNLSHTTLPVKIDLKVDFVEKNIGEVISTAQNRKIKILNFIDQGKRGRVYKVEDVESKKFYALKIAIDQNPETLESFAKELNKNNLYKKYGAAHADILESTSNMILKEWIEGVRADEFFKKWEAQGTSLVSPELLALKDFVAKLAKAGIYIGDLNAKNLIWSNNLWVIVDSGGIKEGLSHEMALSEYLAKIPLKMGKHLSPSCQDVLNLFFKT